MKPDHFFSHKGCPYFMGEYTIGFRKMILKKGDCYSGHRYEFNTMVFMVEGDVEFSYNQYIGRIFAKGDIFFIPQGAEVYGIALAETQMMVLVFDHTFDGHCSSCALKYAGIRSEKEVLRLAQGVKYDFAPLRMTEEILQLIKSVELYIGKDYRCRYLHEIKQKELFVLIYYVYSPRQLLEFFYPVVGEDKRFRSRVHKHAHEQLTTEAYAQKLNMGTRSFLRKFKSEFGMTVQQWTLRHKIARIRIKLLNPNVSASELVDEFNFADSSHLYRFCKEYFGTTFKEILSESRQRYVGKGELS